MSKVVDLNARQTIVNDFIRIVLEDMAETVAMFVLSDKFESATKDLATILDIDELEAASLLGRPTVTLRKVLDQAVSDIIRNELRPTTHRCLR